MDWLVFGLEFGADDPHFGLVDVRQEEGRIEKEAVVEHVSGEGGKGYFRGKDCDEDFHLALDLLIKLIITTVIRM